MNFYFPDEYLYAECTLPQDILETLKKDIDFNENKKIKYNKELAGNIENEYEFIKYNPNFVSFIEKNATDFYIKNNQIKDSKTELELKSLWINKQKKYEFNPLHNHSGLVSFVCWVQIPYKLEDELNLNNCKNSNTSRNSLFEFYYIDYLGNIRTKELMIDKTYEGKCLFFDSKLMHQVYPFYTSDDYRISVSGNFVDKTNNISNKSKLSYN